jgi:hypothetical protein
VPPSVAAKIANRFRTVTQNIQLNITEDQGRPVVVFRPASGLTCAANISGLPQVVGSSYRKLQLTNFHKVGQPGAGCVAGSAFSSWKGWIGLSVNEAGDLTMDASLDSFMDNGTSYNSYTIGHVTFPNAMPPELAAIDAEEKASTAAEKRSAALAKAKQDAKQRQETAAKKKEADDVLKSIEDKK